MFTKAIQPIITLAHAQAYFKILDTDRDEYLNLSIREAGYGTSYIRRQYIKQAYQHLIQLNTQEA